jgi:hypothetical protein
MIDMASATGLALTGPARRNQLCTMTYFVGEMIWAPLDEVVPASLPRSEFPTVQARQVVDARGKAADEAAERLIAANLALACETAHSSRR